MLITLARTVILYTLVMITMRLMGKRQIAQLEPFELVIAIMIAELAVIPMQDRDIPLINGVIAILTLLFIQVTFSVLSLKSLWFRSLLDGEYSIIIANGVIQEAEMRKARYNLHELLEQLRLNAVFNLADVEYAVLETSGDLSVLLKSQARPVTPQDLQLETRYEGLPLILILDGQVMHRELEKAQLSEGWLRTELEKYGAKDPAEILIATLSTTGELFVQRKERPRRRKP
ncbi:MAG TPA: DUF421 domain-containing protein [Bacillales bacterium]|nr:DUF421 domain-containing protein [Bacillales bacterium]